MNRVKEIDFEFVHELNGHHTTILTGRNGSSKSTILREMVNNILKRENDDPISGISLINRLDIPPRILALAGVAADRYPELERSGRPTEIANPSYLYFGQKVGANLISKRRIFDALCLHMLDSEVSDRFEWPFFKRLFDNVGLVRSLCLVFERYRKRNAPPNEPLLSMVTRVASGGLPSSGPWLREVSPQMARYILDTFDQKTFDELHEYVHLRPGKKVIINFPEERFSSTLGNDALRLGIHTGVIHLSEAKVINAREKQAFSVFDLSSGEYHMLSTLLAVAFAVREGDIILLDEPEASLHPQWQVEYMRTLFDITSFMQDGHVIIATHSPLIVSSAKPSSEVIDLSEEPDTSKHVSLFGASADEILLDHFGLVSSRNYALVDKLQRAISLVEQQRTTDEVFRELVPQLRTYRNALSQGDPLIEVIDALLEENDD